MNEVVSAPTARSIAALDKIIDSMNATQEGRHALQQRLSGFIDRRDVPGAPPPYSPILTTANWRRMWSMQSSLRAPLAALLVKAAQVDVYVRTLNRLVVAQTGGTFEIRYHLITELSDLFFAEFGTDLEGVRVERRFVPAGDGTRVAIAEFHGVDEVAAPQHLAAAAGPARSMVHALNTLNTLGQILTASLAAGDYAHKPSAANLLSLTRGIQGVIAGGITMAEQTALMNRGTSGVVLRSLRGSVGAAGLVLGGIALADEIAATRRLATSGDDDQLFWRAVGIGAWSTSMGLEAAALVGISTGPVGTALVIACAVASIVAAVAGAAVADLPIELDFKHTLLGDDYREIAQLDAGDPAAPPPPDPLERTDTSNQRGDFYRSLPTQIAQMKGYLFPLHATFTSEDGILNTSKIIRLRPVVAVEGSIVSFQVWSAGDTIVQRLTEFFQLRGGSFSFATGAPMGDVFHVTALRPTGSRDHWEIDITLDASDRPGNRIPSVDIAAVAVSFQPPTGTLATAATVGDEALVRRIFLETYSFAARTIVELTDA